LEQRPLLLGDRLPLKRVLWLVACEFVVLALLLTLALDLYAHKRVEELGGINIWGYRGTVAHRRQPNEIRVVFVGGTRAFGWGTSAGGTVPAQVRWRLTLPLDRPGQPLRPIVGINLARFGAVTESYPETIEHFAYLQPDYICLYDDLGVPPDVGAIHTSGVFALTGYAPVLPLALREKGMLLRFGDVGRGYERGGAASGSFVSWPRRAIGTVVETVGTGAEAADRLVARMLSRRSRQRAASDVPERAYAEAMMTAIDAARRHARGVVVVLSPIDTPQQARNWSALQMRLDGDPGARPWIRVVDLGDQPDLYDPATRLDGWNFAPEGIVIASQAIAPALLDLIAAQ